MTKLTHNELRNLFLTFFEKREHLTLKSASIVPENDNSTLFTTAGVQPLIPYLTMEQESPATRMASSQKCLRTNDIEEVGDDTHLTFFEMLGSWSIGDYDKNQAIAYAHEFLTSEEGINLPQDRLWFTVFQGSNRLPRDKESSETWENLGIPENRITFLSEDDNWWSMGENGLCGPDTEVFYDTKWPSPVQEGQNPGNDPESRFVEIWNTVFMSFDKQGDILNKLPTDNIDEGAGLERMLSIINNENIYQTSCFKDVYDLLEENSAIKGKSSIKPLRTIADHLRTSLFIMSETPPIYPKATAHGYVLRRLIRSAVTQSQRLDIDSNILEEGLKIFSELYSKHYPEVSNDIESKIKIFKTEQSTFEKTLNRAPKVWKQFTKSAQEEKISSKSIFRMVTEQGIPLDILKDIALTEGKTLDVDGFNELMTVHKTKSRDIKL